MIAKLPGILEISGETERRTRMLFLVLAAIFFAGIHLGVAGTTWRDRAVAALGEGAYRAVFSIASLAGIIWLVMAYRHAPYVTTWGVPVWWKPVAIMLMLPAFLLAVTGLTTSNPTIVGEEGRVARPPEGIVRVTRHPFLIGVGLWAVVHLIANGDLASFIFFGSLAVTALAGTVSIDAKRRRVLGPLGCPSRHKPPSFRSRQLLRAEHGLNRMRSRHGNGSPPSLLMACF
jgi:uncharacterized membrane protein